MPSLYDVLACPRCKVAPERGRDRLRCPSCDESYPIIDGVPIMVLDAKVPDVHHEQELVTQHGYFPWIHRVVLQSLLDDQVVVELGSGNQALDDPAIIRVDVTLSRHVDVVADAHALPFLPGTVDFIFSLAVMEHLRQPFVAAQQMHDALRDGGYVYHECNFVFAYHGYPHHYFNASIQGMQQIFSPFRELRTGVAPYQMPSQALVMVLASYLRDFRPEHIERGPEFAQLLESALEEELIDFDRGFTEETAANVAAGTFFFGLKQQTPGSSCLPVAAMDAWRNDASLQERFPDPTDLSHVDNLMTWARGASATEHAAVAERLASVRPFSKHLSDAPVTREALRSWPLIEPVFGSVFDYPDAAPPRKAPVRAAVSSEEPVPPRRPNDQWGRARAFVRFCREEGIVAGIQRVARKLSAIRR